MREPKRLKPKRLQGRPSQEPSRTVREMARLRQALAEELEANLTQLRTVIEESQRIARELEAVLQQTRLAPVAIPSFPSRRGRRQAGSDKKDEAADADTRLVGAKGLPGGNRS